MTSRGVISRFSGAIFAIGLACGLCYVFLPREGRIGPAAELSERFPEEPGRGPVEFSQEGWHFESIGPSAALERYRLRLNIARTDAPVGEFRVLIERTDDSNFACLRWAEGKLELFRVRSGRRMELAGKTSCAAAPDEIAPAGQGSAGAIVVDRSGGLWAVALGDRDVLIAGDPATASSQPAGDIAWGSTQGWSLVGRSVQPIEPICFEDGFARDTFNEHGTYEVWYGDWSLESVRDIQRTANAFRLRARSSKPGRPAVVTFGHDFWRMYRLEASLRFQGDGASGLVFAVKNRRHFGLVRWRRPLSDSNADGKLEVVEVDRESPKEGEIRDRTLLELPISPRRNQWYRLGVSLFAERAEIDVNGLTRTFELPGALRSGRAGLYANSTDGVQFDDISVRSHGGFLACAGDALSPQDVVGADGRLYLLGEGPAFLRVNFARPYPALKLRWRDGSGGQASAAIFPLFSVGSLSRAGLSGHQFESPSAGTTVFGLEDRKDASYEIELREAECVVKCSSGPSLEGLAEGRLPDSLRLAGIALEGRRKGALELVRGFGGGWPSLTEMVAGPLGPRPTLRQKTRAFSEVNVKQGHEAAEFKWIGFVGWLEDRSSWERSGDAIRCRTPLWGGLSAELEVPPPEEGKAVELALEAEGEPACACGLRLSRIQDGFVLTDTSGAELARPGPSAGKLRLILLRSGEVLEARINDLTVLRRCLDIGRRPVYVVARGERLSTENLKISCESVDESLFEGAPTEWVRWRGYCDIAPKWQCDPRWTFMSVWSDSIDTKQDAAGIFSKASYYGDQELLFYFSFKDVLGGRNNRRYVRRDLNFAFACAGEDLARGYCLLLGGFDDRGTQLLRNGTLVAETNKFRLPPYQGRVEDVHWKWYVLRIQRRGGEIKAWVDDQEVLSWTDPEPLKGGHVAIWTLGNGIILGRTRFSAEARGGELTGFDLAGPASGVPDWSPSDFDRPPRLSISTSGAVRVTNITGGGRFSAVLEKVGPCKQSLAFMAPKGVEVAVYAEKGGKFRRLEPAGPGKWLPADGTWQILRSLELAEGETLVVGCHDAAGYAAAGIGANAAGAWYEVKDFPSAEQAEAFVAAQVSCASVKVGTRPEPLLSEF